MKKTAMHYFYFADNGLIVLGAMIVFVILLLIVKKR